MSCVREAEPFQFSLATLMTIVTVVGFYLAFTISAPFHAVVVATIFGALLFGAVNLTVGLYRDGMDRAVSRSTDKLSSFVIYALVVGIILPIGAACVLDVRSLVKSVFGW
jgi:hypothetical protein